MNRAELIEAIKVRKSFLCVGLDSDVSRLPEEFTKDAEGMLAFNKRIIDATMPYCVAYKPNTAFYEALGSEGWQALEETIKYIPNDKFIIADAKRGDIGNTSRQYAMAFFDQLNCDAITVAPYMGQDSVRPFLDFPNKWIIVLGLTSNAGSNDFQLQSHDNGFWFEEIIRKTTGWGTLENTMFVVGATHPDYLTRIRNIIPDHFLLVPGIGAQGGNLDEVCNRAMNDDVGLLMNSSRSIIFASSGSDFAEKAANQAREIQLKMKKILNEAGL